MTVVETPAGTAGQFGVALRMIGNETVKGLQIMWSHKATLLPQLGFLTFMYWAVQYFIGGGRIVPELVPQTFVAYLAFIIAYIALLRMAGGVLEELFSGTLEQSLLSPLRPWVLSIGRFTATLIEGLLMVLLVAALFVPLLKIRIPFRQEALLTLFLTVADAAGFALLIGGLAVIVNSIGAIVHVIWSMMLMVNGSFVPVDLFPVWLELIAKLFPTTLGVDATRRILFMDTTLAELWSDNTLLWTVLHAVTMVVLGWTVFQAAIRRGLKNGRLGP